jgi:hypothetical protein
MIDPAKLARVSGLPVYHYDPVTDPEQSRWKKIDFGKALKLVTEFTNDYADDSSANGSHADSRPISFCDDASGILSSRPKQRPTAHPGRGRRAAPITNPIPKRAMKAAMIAAFLSGTLIGSMIPTSIAPNTKPQIMPNRTLDMFHPSYVSRFCWFTWAAPSMPRVPALPKMKVGECRCGSQRIQFSLQLACSVQLGFEGWVRRCAPPSVAIPFTRPSCVTWLRSLPNDPAIMV